LNISWLRSKFFFECCSWCMIYWSCVLIFLYIIRCQVFVMKNSSKLYLSYTGAGQPWGSLFCVSWISSGHFSCNTENKMCAFKTWNHMKLQSVLVYREILWIVFWPRR
jgi:hypothetical protein